jgi:hypothetical protein
MTCASLNVHFYTPAALASQRSVWTGTEGCLREEAEKRIDAHLRENHPRCHWTYDAAAADAQAAAPALDDVDEMVDLLAVAHGSVPAAREEVEQTEPPRHASYIIELELHEGVRILATNDLDKATHVASGSMDTETDALWLPDTDDCPGGCLRIITRRSLLGSFRLLRCTTVPALARR